MPSYLIRCKKNQNEGDKCNLLFGNYKLCGRGISLISNLTSKKVSQVCEGDLNSITMCNVYVYRIGLTDAETKAIRKNLI